MFTAFLNVFWERPKIQSLAHFVLFLGLFEGLLQGATGAIGPLGPWVRPPDPEAIWAIRPVMCDRVARDGAIAAPGKFERKMRRARVPQTQSKLCF